MTAGLAADGVIEIGVQVAKVLNGILEKLPNYEQKKLEEFYKFLDLYNEEILRVDSDSYDLVLWKHRRKILVDTIIQGLLDARKK